jgi:penicillin amidase
MKIIKSILVGLIILVGIVLVAGFLMINRIKKSALPVYEGELNVAVLESNVTVYRDIRGMPHIIADNEHDLYVATGYVMAQERLWQMDLIRRATTGRLSEIFGKEYIQTDLFLRSLEMTAKSRLIISSEDPKILAAMQAFTEGVNAFIDAAGKKLPPEFKILSYRPDPWKMEDIANIIGYMGWDLASGNLTSDIFYYKLVKKLGIEKATQLIPDWKAVNSYVFPDLLFWKRPGFLFHQWIN